MKYGILVDVQNLSGMTLGTMIVTSNPLLVLRDSKYNSFKLLQLEEELAVGNYRCTIQNNKVQISKDKTYGCKPIDLSKHLIVFEPDANFEQLGTGFMKEISFLKLKDENLKDKDFFLYSDKDGPKTWSNGVLRDGKLYSSASILDVIKLSDDNLTK